MMNNKVDNKAVFTFFAVLGAIVLFAFCVLIGSLSSSQSKYVVESENAVSDYLNYLETEKGDLDSIISNLEVVAKAKSKSFPVRRSTYYLALSYMNKGDYSKAIEMFEAAKKGLSDYLTALSQVGIAQCYISLSKNDLALNELENSWKKYGKNHPNASQVLFNLVFLYLENNSEEKAKEKLDVLISLFPNAEYTKLAKMIGERKD